MTIRDADDNTLSVWGERTSKLIDTLELEVTLLTTGLQITK